MRARLLLTTASTILAIAVVNAQLKKEATAVDKADPYAVTI